MIRRLRPVSKTFGASQPLRFSISSPTHSSHTRFFSSGVASELGHIRTSALVPNLYRLSLYRTLSPTSLFGTRRRLLLGVSQGAQRIPLGSTQHLGRLRYSTAATLTTTTSPLNNTMSSNSPASPSPSPPQAPKMKTQIIKVSQGQGDSPFGSWSTAPPTPTPTPTPQDPSPPTQEINLKTGSPLNTWLIPATDATNLATLIPLQQAATYLQTRDIPVAFPTETVYGLGADATRSNAVRGIYTAKGRPSDNPLIVHVCDLDMLRSLLSPPSPSPSSSSEHGTDPIPEIYHPLIAKFWPGPLTILLPNPNPTPQSSKSSLTLAPEVTATLPTFGARMPSSPLARTLIKLTGKPLAAPSANASTKPSPTTAQHVLDDLDGKIELILDGGSCSVGVESTVVDGLCIPPVVLRPGGVSIEELRQVKGWEGVQKAYKDYAEHGNGNGNGEIKSESAAPRAPGMKYKHYSPRAKVVLYEAGLVSNRETKKEGVLREEDLQMAVGLQGEGEEKKASTIAVIRTSRWPVAAGLSSSIATTTPTTSTSIVGSEEKNAHGDLPFRVTQHELTGSSSQIPGIGEREKNQEAVKLLDVDLGKDVRAVAHGLFAALRELDRRGADVIFVEGVRDGDGEDIAAAVMNRLRKAASVIRS